MNNKILNHMKFMDRKEVNLLTTIHDDKKVDTKKVDRTTKQRIFKYKAVHDYNTYMGAVDRSDQMLQYAAFKRRTLKWWKKLFFHLFMLAEVNCFLLYKHAETKNGKTPLPHKDFRKELAKQMTLPRRKEKLVSSSTEEEVQILRLATSNNAHFPSPVANKARRRCHVCSLSIGKRKDSYYQCKDCDKGLCIYPCFMLFHSYADFKSEYKKMMTPE